MLAILWGDYQATLESTWINPPNNPDQPKKEVCGIRFTNISPYEQIKFADSSITFLLPRYLSWVNDKKRIYSFSGNNIGRHDNQTFAFSERHNIKVSILLKIEPSDLLQEKHLLKIDPASVAQQLKKDFGIWLPYCIAEIKTTNKKTIRINFDDFLFIAKK